MFLYSLLLIAAPQVCLAAHASFEDATTTSGTQRDLINPAEHAALKHRSARATYVAIEITGDCAARLEEAHIAYTAPSEFHRLPTPLPRGKSVLDFPIKLEDFGMMGAHKAFSEMRWLVTYEDVDPLATDHEGARQVYGHVFLDPRIRMADGIYHAHDNPQDVADGKPLPMRHFLSAEPEVHTLYLPRHITRFNLYCHNTSAAIPFSIAKDTRSRHFHRLQDGGAPDYKVFQLKAVGPVDNQVSVVFLSGGFTAEEEGLYNKTIERIVDFMEPTYDSSTKELNNMHSTVPFDRYWPFFNVWSVFQPSRESGCSRPLIGQNIDNNLKCQHPETLERAINCNMKLSIALADVTPATIKSDPDKTLIVVAVNTRIYGGSALFKKKAIHVGYFYLGENEKKVYDELKYASLVKHEMGHAYGNLFDEYDVGISESASIKLENCQAPVGGGTPTGNDLQWIYWSNIMANTNLREYYRGSTKGLQAIDAGVDSNSGLPKWNVLNTPLPICGYSNYYKPNSHCMMQSVRDYYMCPVCREAASKQMMESTHFQKFWPRFPTEDAILVVPESGPKTLNTVADGIVFQLPSYLTVENDFTVTWYDVDGTTELPKLVSVDCPQCLRVSGSALGDTAKYPRGLVLKFHARIMDNTTFISDNVRPELEQDLVQHTTFSVRIVQTEAIATNLTNVTLFPVSQTGAFGRNPFAKQTLQQCLWNQPGGRVPFCSPTFSTKVYEKPEDIDGLIAAFDSWVLYLMAGIAVLFLLLWIWACNYYTKKGKSQARSILDSDFKGAVKIVRKIMLFSAVGFMVASIAVMGLSGWYYTKTSSLGKIIIFAGLSLAISLYIMAFVGYWAVTYRAKKLVLVNGGVLYFGLTCLVVIAALIVSIGEGIANRNSYWNRNLAKFWTTLIKENPERACAIQAMLKCSGFYIPCNTVIGSTEYCPSNCEATNALFGTACQKLIQRYVSDNYTTTIYVVFACIAMMFIGLMFNFFYYFRLMQLKRALIQERERKVHRTVQRTQSKSNLSTRQVNRCKALFILKSLDTGDVDKLVTEFDKIDIDGNGQLDQKEFVTFFRKTLQYKPSREEIEDIFKVADLDRDGTISLEEFLCLFGDHSSAVGRSNRHGKKTALRATVDPARREEMRRRAAQVYGETGLFDNEMSHQSPSTNSNSSAAASNRPPGKAAHRAGGGGAAPLPTNSSSGGGGAPYRPPTERPPTPPGLL